jgi:hypothetical protein
MSSYSMHLVVQDGCRFGLVGVNESNKVELLTIALASVGYAVPYTAEREYWFLQRGLLPHADKMAMALNHDCDMLLEPSILKAVRNPEILYSDQGKLKEAVVMHQRGLTGYKSVSGLDHTDSLLAVHDVASHYRKQGNLQEA